VEVNKHEDRPHVCARELLQRSVCVTVHTIVETDQAAGGRFVEAGPAVGEHEPADRPDAGARKAIERVAQGGPAHRLATPPEGCQRLAPKSPP